MSNTSKQKVKDYFKYDRSFEGACTIYRSLPGKSLAIVRRMNAGNQGNLLEHIWYELAKLVGIPDQVKDTMLAQPLQVKGREEEGVDSPENTGPLKLVSFDPETITEEEILTIDVANADYFQMKALVKRLGLETPDQKGPSLQEALTKYIEYTRAKRIVAFVPEAAVKGLRLRDEFPFLKDPACPDELKILVSDRISAYQKYVALHEQVQSGELTEEQLAEAAITIVENYLENRQIWDELNHYKEHGKPLGKHPVWHTSKLQKEIEALDVKGIIKMLNSLGSSRSAAKKKIEAEQAKESPDQEKIANWQKIIEEKDWLTEVCNSRLDRANTQ